jgi:hypothetical protein
MTQILPKIIFGVSHTFIEYKPKDTLKTINMHAFKLGDPVG